MLAVTALAAEAPKNKHTSRMELKLKTSPAEPDKSQSADTERSHYFIKKEPQHRLGEDFFNQPCITLAKEFLGKVMLPLLTPLIKLNRVLNVELDAQITYM